MNPFYEQYMAVMPPVKYRDHLIEDFSVNALAPFLDQDGALSENLDVVMKGSKFFSETLSFLPSQNTKRSVMLLRCRFA